MNLFKEIRWRQNKIIIYQMQKTWILKEVTVKNS